MSELKRSKNTLLIAAGLVALAAQGALGQAIATTPQAQRAAAQLPAFEVASIRLSNADNDLRNFMISATRFRVENGTVTALIRFAYNIKSDDQLPKEPRWIGVDKFDIDAKIADSQGEAMNKLAPDQKFEQYRMMVQSLLMDRFKLEVSRQMKEIPVYALTVAKNGPKPTMAKVTPQTQMQRMPTLTGGSRGELRAGAVSMAMFTDWLSGRDDIGGRVVIDETALPGSYDFLLSWTLDEAHKATLNGAGASQGESSANALESSGPSILTALQEQLGLKLESTKAKVEALVIDHIEKPSAN
jgi:uncharacterized protein (TIGR03435 family)